MEAYRLCWPESETGWPPRGLLLLVAVEPGENGDGRTIPCRVVGSLTPGSPFQMPENRQDPESRVTALLNAIGVPTNLRGYAYLRSALLLALSQPELLRGLNRRLYPAVAGEHGATAASVERAIRHAVASAWARGGGERCRQLMGRECSCVGDHPSNGELLTLLADRLLLERRTDGMGQR